MAQYTTYRGEDPLGQRPGIVSLHFNTASNTMAIALRNKILKTVKAFKGKKKWSEVLNDGTLNLYVWVPDMDHFMANIHQNWHEFLHDAEEKVLLSKAGPAEKAYLRGLESKLRKTN